MKIFKKLTVLLLMVYLSISCVSAAELSFTIYHTSDVHGRYQNYPKLWNIIDNARKEGDTMLLDSGDTFHGLPFANLEKGGSIASVLEPFKYDAITAGNHDFNYGYKRLNELGSKADTKILAANVKTNDGSNVFTPYITKDIGGFKVAVIGLTAGDTKTKTAPKNTEGIIFEDPVETAEKLVSELKNNVDFIIALTHLGSLEGQTSIELSETVPEIDLVLDGHSHNIINSGKVIGSGCYLSEVTAVKVNSDKSFSVDNIEISDEMPENETIKKIISDTETAQSPLLSQVIGKSDTFLNGEYTVIRTRESNLGRLIADSYRYAADSQIGIENSGGIRASIYPGDITMNSVYSVQPFGNYIVKKQLTGKALKTLFEDALSCIDTMGGSGMQMSGAHLVYDSSKKVGERVIDITVDGKPVKDDDLYTVATNNYYGDTFSSLKDAETTGIYGATDEALAEYIKTGNFISQEKNTENLSASPNYEITLDAYTVISDVNPYIENGSAYLPFRAVMEHMGYTVSWNETENTASAEKEGYETITVSAENTLNGRTMIEDKEFSELIRKYIFTDTDSLSINIVGSVKNS